MNEDIERAEIEKLLPWYVTGRLGRADTSKVEIYLSQHPDVLAQLDLIRAERQETVHANAAIGLPPSGMLDRLMASLPPTSARLSGGWLSSLVHFFTLPTARGSTLRSPPILCSGSRLRACATARWPSTLPRSLPCSRRARSGRSSSGDRSRSSPSPIRDGRCRCRAASPSWKPVAAFISRTRRCAAGGRAARRAACA